MVIKGRILKSIFFLPFWCSYLIRLARGSTIILLVFVVDVMVGDAKRCESIHMFFYHALLCFDLLETWNFVIECHRPRPNYGRPSHQIGSDPEGKPILRINIEAQDPKGYRRQHS